MRSVKKKINTTRVKSDDLHKSREESDGSDEEEGDETDYTDVLVTGGGIQPKLPQLDEHFKLDSEDKQSRADITDLVANLRVFYARLMRIKNAKLLQAATKSGKEFVPFGTSLFAAETEHAVGRNIDLIGKLTTSELERKERKRWEDTSAAGREAMEEFMATVKECVGKSVGCKNLIRKMHSGLQMLNAIRAVFVGTSQSRLKQVENATDDIKALRLKRGQTVADLLQELSNLINVRDDCSDTPMESELKGFFLMEIMRNSESGGGG